MPRRKPNDAANLMEDIANSSATPLRKKHEPQEIRIYIKLLKKALKYLPLGSRAYYYVAGEVARANSELKKAGIAGSGQGQRDDASKPPHKPKDEKS